MDLDDDLSGRLWYAEQSQESMPGPDVQLTHEIRNLAAGLGNRPLDIFRYVYNNYDYVPYELS